MSENIKTELVRLAYKLFTRIKDTDFEYIYKGGFSQKVSKKLLSLAEANVQNTANKTSLKNKIYFVMVEGLQNVTKHQNSEEITESTDNPDGMFAIQKNQDKYFITTGNIIKSEEEKTLKPKLEQLNLLEKDQLTKIRKNILINGKLSDKGGAGLGLIEMARKSGKQLVYDFKPVDEKNTFFYFRTEIPGEKVKNASTAPSVRDDESINDIKQLHEKLEKENILINFNGQFNRDNILSLLSVIKGQMNVNISSRKVYSIMVEMLQNISKHTNGIDGIKKNRGIFFLSKTDNEFILTSGNYLENSGLDSIKAKVDAVNSMNKEELYKRYDEVLLGDNDNDGIKTGLGFIDMRLKSNNPLNYHFIKLDDELSFFALQSTVKYK